MVKELNPLVSICIPTFNGEKYIEEALKSAINQTYTNLEIIISDDASIDKTLEIINRYKNLTPIPFYIYNHVPNGIGANWNNCVKKASGKYIKFLFQDDILFDNCIETMMKLALSNSKVGLVYSKRKFLYDTSNEEHNDWIQDFGILHKSWADFEIKQGIEKGTKYLKNYSLLHNHPMNKIGEPTAVLLRKNCFEKTGYFDENLRQTLDYEYWYRVMKYFDIGFIDEELIAFRLHKDQATFVNKINKHYDNKLYNNFYKTIYWQLHFKSQWMLFKSESRIGIMYRGLKKIVG